ncbi:MAG: hypothetical protein IH960_08415 [Chloroflexi bacterium]|nr:hypothetical protein [Chloroflexota bacterium]
MNGDRKKANAVIWYIAARRCLKESLELLYKNFNDEYQYPVVIYSFGEHYSEKFKKDIWDRLDSTIQFVTLDEQKVPAHIPESELYYHRTEIEYVREYFPASRIGYLHMCNFVSGYSMHRPELAKYDFGLKMDDDAFFVKKVPNDILLEAETCGYVFAPMATSNMNTDRSRQTQIGIRELLKDYLSSEGLVPSSESIDENGEWNGDGPRDPTIWDFRIFREEKYQKWWNLINKSGGIYKYRWGDLEVQTLFVKIHYPDSAWHDLGLFESGVMVHGGYGPVFSWQSSYAGRILHNVILSPGWFIRNVLNAVRRKL